MPGPALALHRASKRYGERPALEDVTFRVEHGGAVGYLGPNGAGKTTTLRLLAGLARPDGGAVELLGLDAVRDGPRALRRAGILVETPGYPPYVTGRDLLEHVGRTKGLGTLDLPRAIRATSDRLDLAEHIDRPLGTLSTGLARRLLLGTALLNDPEVLLLDEPTLGLDPAARVDLRAVLASLAAEGRTILLSTHILEDVEAVCDSVLFLRAGRLVGEEPVARAPVDGAGVPLRALRLEFLEEVRPNLLAGLAGEGGHAEFGNPREATVYFRGDAGRQREILAEGVRRGLPIVSAGPPASDLDRRYLEKVGREEGDR